MSDDVYRPDASRDFLVARDGSRIELTPHLYFADNDPILSFRNSGYECGKTRYDFYRAVRITKDLMVEDVQWKDETIFPQDRIKSDLTIVQRGSMLVRTFEAAAGERPEWYALSWRQQVHQNMQRKEYDPGKGSRSVECGFGDGCSYAHGDVERIVEHWKDKKQAAAHIQDARDYTREWYLHQGAREIRPGVYTYGRVRAL